MREQSGLLKNYWYAACLSKELKNLPVRREILETPIVLWRTEEGIASALLDRCCHRNAPLSKGTIENGCIVCPYHSWKYDVEGCCVEIPSEGPNQNRSSKSIVEKFPLVERDGLIWVWMGKDILPDKEPFSMPLGDSSQWHHYYMITLFDNNVTNLVENFMDVPHTISVHKGWFRSEKKVSVPTIIERTENSVEITYNQKNDTIGFTEKILNPKGLPMTHTDKFFMPNITRVDYIFGNYERAFVITSTCTPISPYKTIVYTLISFKLDWFNAIAKIILPFYTRKVIDQDVWIMDIQGKNLQKFKKAEFMSTSVDTMHLYIESLIEWAQQGGANPKPKPMKKDIDFWI